MRKRRKTLVSIGVVLLMSTLVLQFTGTGVSANTVFEPICITDGETFVGRAVTAGDNIVWQEYAGTECQIMSYNIPSGESSTLSTNPQAKPYYYRPSWIGEDYACWTDKREMTSNMLRNKIYASNLDDGVEFKVSHPESIYSTYGTIWNNYIAFVQFFPEEHSMKSGLYLVDMSSPMNQILIQPTNDVPARPYLVPFLNDGRIVWNIHTTLYLYDIETQTIDVVDDNVKSPSCLATVSGDYVYYMSFGDDICYYNIESGMRGVIAKTTKPNTFYITKNPETENLVYTKKFENGKKLYLWSPIEGRTELCHSKSNDSPHKFSLPTNCATDRYVVWCERYTGRCDLVLYDIENKTTEVLTELSFDRVGGISSVSISNSRVSWTENVIVDGNYITNIKYLELED